jgi:hypothetical protein
MEHIPSFIFDLIESTSFHGLSEAQRNLVLQHMPEEEYNTLRNAAMEARRFAGHDESPQPANRIRTQLMEHLEQQQQTATLFKMIINRPVAVWKVAAMFLLLGGATILMAKMKKNVPQIRYITQIDTLYLEKEGPRIYDTVYLTREAEYPVRSTRHSYSRVTENTSALPDPLPEHYNGINLVPASEKDRPINNKKGVNIKDDSLISSYGFVRL